MTELVVLHYHDREVTFDPTVQMWNLTAMYKASGSPRGKEPWRWSERDQTKELIAALQDRLRGRSNLGSNLGSNLRPDEVWPEVWETRQGNAGGTWAHWQIAAAYAHYLDPQFYLTWNEWAMERHEQTASPMTPASHLASIETRLTALEAAQATQAAHPTMPAVLMLNRPLDEIARAIVEVLLASQAPRTPAEIIRILKTRGWSGLSNDRMKTRMARMAQRGAIQKCGRGLYTYRGKTVEDDTNTDPTN